MGILKTQATFEKEIFEKFGGNIKVLGKYIDRKTEVLFECVTCSEIFLAKPINIFRTSYGCPKCINTYRREAQLKTFKEIKEKFVDRCPDASKYWDYENNIGVDINTLSWHSPYYAHWTCPDCGYKWRTKISTMADGKQHCPECYKKSMSDNVIKYRLKRDGSLRDNYPELLNEWNYEKNIGISPDNILSKSQKKVWWKCHACGHEWISSVAHRTEGKGCPYCARHTKSKLQCAIEQYLLDSYDYTVLHEHECTLKCINPKTGYRLPYDNEVVLSDDIRLIIECHGQQHYELCGWIYTEAKSKNADPEDVLKELQYRDNIKKDCAILNGYYYLAIPYTAEADDSYKSLIDEKIQSILNNTKLLETPEREAI